MDPKLQENRLKRERSARKQAEQILEQKSYELFCTNEALKATAQELDLQTVQLNSILENTAAAIMVADEEGRIIRFNKKAGALFSPTLSETGTILTCLFDPKSQAAIEALFATGNSEAEPAELFALRENGPSFPVDASVAHLTLEDNNHTVWICRDLRVRKQMEQELRQAQKMEALGSLASGVAHEINTPIQFVSDNIRFLQDSFEDLMSLIETYQKTVKAMGERVTADEQKALQKAESDADLDFLLDDLPDSIEQSLDGMQRIGKIVAAIKEFSHPGVEDNVAIDLNQAIETTATVTKNQWKYVANLDLTLAQNLPPIYGNPGDFNQVVLNLIVNAAHAIEETGRSDQGAILITTEADDKAVTLRIADDGCGIPEEARNKIFDPFYTTKEVGKGTGQGLAITYNIVVNKMNGDIAVHSAPGEGTSFVIRLPREKGGAL